jgi:hypothetical protein
VNIAFPMGKIKFLIHQNIELDDQKRQGPGENGAKAQLKIAWVFQGKLLNSSFKKKAEALRPQQPHQADAQIALVRLAKFVQVDWKAKSLGFPGNCA